MKVRTRRLLDTPTTRRWTDEQRATADEYERRCVYEGFREEDSGRSRVKIAECATVAQAREVVGLINAADDADHRPSGLVHRSMFEQMVERVAELEAKLVQVTAERDKWYSTLAGLFWSGVLDQMTGKEAREPGEKLVARLAAAEAEVGAVHDALRDREPTADSQTAREVYALVHVLARRFPIMGGPSIPWRMILPHEAQAQANHSGQTLERLAERGGLSPEETLAVLDDVPFFNSPWSCKPLSGKGARDELEKRLLKFEGPEPGEPVCACSCPCCGAELSIEQGDDENETSVVGTPGKGSWLAVREPVQWFAEEMERKLRANDDRDGWKVGRLDWLFDRLTEEVEELRVEVGRRAGLHIIDECTDVANFAMMIADRVRE